MTIQPASVVFVAWVVFAAVGTYLFYIRRDAAFKRRYLPWYLSVAGSASLGAALVFGVPPLVVLLMVPVVVGFGAVNVALTRFCAACGQTMFGSLYRPRWCSRCGGRLQ